MSYPGFQAQQAAQQNAMAAQQAQMAASRAAQQNASYASAYGMRSARVTHHHSGGGGGMIGRLLSVAGMLVFLVVVAAIGLVVLDKVDPHLAAGIWSWLDRL